MAKDMRTQPTSPNSIPTSQPAGFFKKKGCRPPPPEPAAAARQPFFFEKSGRLGCGNGIRRCRLCSHILCHQFQPIFSPFSLKINPILLKSTQNLNFPSASIHRGTLMSRTHVDTSKELFHVSRVDGIGVRPGGYTRGRANKTCPHTVEGIN